jgi:hypothetical protein
MAQQNVALAELAGKFALLAANPLQIVPAPAQAPFPLSKRECLAAFVLMGLASRLQPVQGNNLIDRKKVVDLAFDMANLAMANCNDQ